MYFRDGKGAKGLRVYRRRKRVPRPLLVLLREMHGYVLTVESFGLNVEDMQELILLRGIVASDRSRLSSVIEGGMVAYILENLKVRGRL